jgi:hypothetical protein
LLLDLLLTLLLQLLLTLLFDLLLALLLDLLLTLLLQLLLTLLFDLLLALLLYMLLTLLLDLRLTGFRLVGLRARGRRAGRWEGFSCCSGQLTECWWLAGLRRLVWLGASDGPPRRRPSRRRLAGLLLSRFCSRDRRPLYRRGLSGDPRQLLPRSARLRLRPGLRGRHRRARFRQWFSGSPT